MNQFFEQIIEDYPEFSYDPNNSEDLICVHNNIVLCRIEARDSYFSGITYAIYMYRPIGDSTYYYVWQVSSCLGESGVIASIKKVLQLIEKIDRLSPDLGCSTNRLEQLGFFKKTPGEYWLHLKNLLVVIIIPHIGMTRCFLKYKVKVSTGPYDVVLDEACDSLDEALSKLTD